MDATERALAADAHGAPTRDGTRAPHLFVSAGDTSGDQHAARLVRHLRTLVPGLSVEALGGQALAAEGVPLHRDLVQGAIFGIGPALAAVPDLLGLLRRVAGVFDARRPDLVVLVDYPGLNLHVARMAHRRGIPVVYFVAPQLWAWAPWRVRRFARAVDEALVIFPFEVPFFEAAGLQAHYVGHPLLDALPTSSAIDAAITELPRPVALLPGSRPREVRDHFPMMLEAAKLLLSSHPDASFHAAHVSAEQRANLERIARERDVPVTVHGDRVHAVMASCCCALVASGTATLETALLGTPLVVFYRSTPFEKRLADWLLVPPFIGQVNLILGRELVPEVILTDEEPAALADALRPLLEDGAARELQLAGLRELAQRTGGAGAVQRAAEHIAQRLLART